MEVLYGESRRRYMQALTPIDREGLSGVSRTDVDEVSGLPPAIYLGRGRRGRDRGRPAVLQLEREGHRRQRVKTHGSPSALPQMP